MDYADYIPGLLEVRQEGRLGGPSIYGEFRYGRLATVADRGYRRKETFSERAFQYAVEDEQREINVLVGHDFNRSLASRDAGSLEIRDSAQGVTFTAHLPREEDMPTYMLDTVKQLRAGLVRGLSPGFSVPPASVVPSAETVIPEPGNPQVGIRVIRAAVLNEFSLVTRPAYRDASVVEVRFEGPDESDPRVPANPRRGVPVAVTLTELGAALRITDGTAEPEEPIRSILNRYLGVASAWVENEAPDAPQQVKDEAIVRMSSYLYDAPPAAPGRGFANAWGNSGAALLVSRWRVVRVSL